MLRPEDYNGFKTGTDTANTSPYPFLSASAVVCARKTTTDSRQERTLPPRRLNRWIFPLRESDFLSGRMIVCQWENFFIHWENFFSQWQNFFSH